jgi:hypothetical protein
MRSDCQIDIFDISAAKSDCVVCAFLLRAAQPHFYHENRGCYITRYKSALTIGDDRRRFLQLGTTTLGYELNNLLIVYVLCRVPGCP